MTYRPRENWTWPHVERRSPQHTGKQNNNGQNEYAHSTTVHPYPQAGGRLAHEQKHTQYLGIRKAPTSKDRRLGHNCDFVVRMPETLVYPISGSAYESIRRYSSNEWITTPERSLGSNHVVFGGMILPVSAMSISCCIETG